jgi:hypothetical protein
MEQNNEQVEKKEILEPAPNNVPKCLIEFCCHCFEDEWDEFYKKLLVIQNQLGEVENGFLGRILYYKNSRDFDVDDRIKWLSENSSAHYIKFVNTETEITENFVADCFAYIGNFHIAMKELKEFNIIKKKN